MVGRDTQVLFYILYVDLCSMIPLIQLFDSPIEELLSLLGVRKVLMPEDLEFSILFNRGVDEGCILLVHGTIKTSNCDRELYRSYTLQHGRSGSAWMC